MTTPWVVYGQTAISSGGVLINPAPNVNGLVGEVTSLPYTVPVGQVLVLEKIGIEPLWGAGIIPLIDDTSGAMAHQLFTVQGGPGYPNTAPPSGGNTAVPSSVVLNFDYHIPAGKILSIRLSANWNPGPNTIYSWMLSGHLESSS